MQCAPTAVLLFRWSFRLELSMFCEFGAERKKRIEHN